MRRWIIIIVIVVAIGAGLYFFGPFRQQRGAASLEGLQTATIERGELTASVGATGIVHANQSAQLAWQTSGTVDTVDVRVGDQVVENELLATLEKTSLSQAVIMAQADLVNAQKALDDLQNSQLGSARALQAVEDAEQALEDAQNPELLQARALEAVVTAEKALEDAERNLRYAQSTADPSLIDEAEAQVVILKDQLDKAKDKFGPYENKPEDNLTRARLQSEMAAAQQRYDAAVRNLNGLTGTASATDQAIAAANVEKAKAQLDDAQREWERVKDGTSEADIALLEAQLDDAKREWERMKDGPDPDDIAAAEARVAAAQAALDLANISAPFAGTITQVNIKSGDQAAPGTSAFRLDDLSQLLVDVQVSEVDINRIQSGLPARLIFDAILDKEYEGTVTELALVGTNTQGVVDFTVTIELNNPDADVRPGMTAAVNIVVEQLDDVLLVPNRAVRILNGERVVYILENNTPTPVQITLGASSETHSEVLEGDISPGDLVVLNPPTVFDQNGPPPFVQD